MGLVFIHLSYASFELETRHIKLEIGVIIFQTGITDVPICTSKGSESGLCKFSQIAT